MAVDEKKAAANKPTAHKASTDGGAKKASVSHASEATSNSTERKIIFSLAYLFGILFFLPLIMYKDDEARFHANQGLVLFLFASIGEVVLGVLSLIPVLGLFFQILTGIYGLAILVFSIIGIVNVCKGERRELPVIGNIRLIR